MTRFSSLIAEARLANQYVKSKMVFGASNKLGDTLPTLGFSILATNKARELQDQELAVTRKGLKPNMPEWNLAYIEAMASSARQMGAGNCGEQSALAFAFLRQKGVRPLDFCWLDDGKHAFLVLNSPVNITPTNFTTWSVDAVICDPWYGRAEIAGMFAAHHPGRRVVSEYRLE